MPDITIYISKNPGNELSKEFIWYDEKPVQNEFGAWRGTWDQSSEEIVYAHLFGVEAGQCKKFLVTEVEDTNV